MKVRSQAYDSNFLVHMIYAGPPRLRIELASQGSTVGHFNMDDIGWMKVLAPPLHEQLLIVDSIAKETEGLRLTTERTAQEIDLLHEYRTRLIADVVTGKLDVREISANLTDEMANSEAFDPSIADDEAEDDGQEGTEADLDDA
jgi:type I restriction enzyme S subunit